MEGNSLLCKKCNTLWPDAEEAFYYDDRISGYRKPCKKCISEYNKRPDQHEKRMATNQKYLKSEKGRAAVRRYVNKRNKKRREERRHGKN